MNLGELLFELSHPTRLEIFRLLTRKPERLTQIAGQVEARPPEASRHLDRLRNSGLAERRSDGAYAATPTGNLVGTLLPALDFVATHTEFLREHDLSLLPDILVQRIGDLARCEVGTGTVSNIEQFPDLLRRCEERLSCVTAELSREPDPDFGKKVSSGLTLRFVVDNSFRPPAYVESTRHLFRVIPKIPVDAIITEREAVLAFPDLKGRIDYSIAFFSKDSQFLKWCEDLVSDLWTKGESLTRAA